LADNAAALGRFLRGIRGETLHLIAHSMGGLLILKLFDLGLGRDLPPGRIVLTGSPVRGCRSAERLARLPLGRAMLGRSATEGLLARGEPRWQGARDLGVIAGDLGLGLGRLLGRFTAPNDGTVLVEETDLPGATERLILPVSHSGMVFSGEVARQAAAYLQRGRFDAKG
jgi:pimeloyl-ACP methyl ester carboxylesterase